MSRDPEGRKETTEKWDHLDLKDHKVYKEVLDQWVTQESQAYRVSRDPRATREPRVHQGQQA